MLRDSPLLNVRLLELLARAGHTELIVIADAGLPIPTGVELIDLSLRPGVPSLLDVFDTISQAFLFESVIAAEEGAASPLIDALRARLDGRLLEQVSHEQFKTLTAAALAVVRTGEFTPYGNLALVAGVAF